MRGRGRFAASILVCLAMSACATTAKQDGFSNDTSSPTALGVGRDDPALVELRGKNANEIRAKLGNPGFLRRDADAEIWQYYADGCVLDLFFQGGKGVQKSVAHIDLRGNGGKPQTDRKCLMAITANQQPR